MGAAVQPLPPAPPPVRVSYTYHAELLPLAISDTQTADVVTDADSDFFCEFMTGIAGTTDLVFTAAPPLLVQFRGSAQGEDWSSAPIPWISYFGRGDQKDFYPFHFRPARRLARNSTTRMTVQNLDAGNAYRIRVALHGYKQYVA